MNKGIQVNKNLPFLSLRIERKWLSETKCYQLKNVTKY